MTTMQVFHLASPKRQNKTLIRCCFSTLQQIIELLYSRLTMCYNIILNRIALGFFKASNIFYTDCNCTLWIYGRCSRLLHHVIWCAVLTQTAVLS